MAAEREVAKRAIYLHTDAAARGVEPGLVVAQAVLELMAWQILVNETKALSRPGFDGLSAADKLRLLLNQCKIPLAIPSTLSDLRSFAARLSTADGPEALTQIRNRWVHPPRKGGLTPGGPEQVDAWRLALWYSDLLLLHWFGFDGPYTSRVTQGLVEVVPWA